MNTNEAHGPKAIVLLSGGMDSAVTLASAHAEGYACYALSVDYGQRHHAELDSARAVAARCSVMAHKILALDLRAIGGSALTADIAVPQAEAPGIPVTYVPARNTIFLSLALAWAEVVGAESIFIGANAVDYSGYPDCRPEFVQAFERLANLATKAAVEGGRIKIQAPLMSLEKSDIVRLGISLGLDFSITVSCYQATAAGLACGRCDSCRLRARGFSNAGIPDPTRYAE